MRTPLWVCGVLAATALCAFGCKKKQAAVTAPPITINGITVDLPQLELTLTNKDCQTDLSDIRSCFRYENYKRAQEDIERVASNASLTDEQKAAAAKVVDQIKQIRASATSGIR